jgi:hypothetical protein
VWSKSLGLILLKIKENFLKFRISSIGVYAGCCAVAVSEKLPKIPLFGPPLIHQLQLLGSQQHLQRGFFFILFSTWGTEYTHLAEIKLESDKRL